MRSAANRVPPPIFIAGAARSGTTLIRWIVDTHPNIVCRGEQIHLADHVHGFMKQFLNEPNGFGFDKRKLTNLRERYEMRMSPAAIGRSFRAFHESFYRELARRAKKPRWADGTHAVLDYCIGAVDEIYARQARFIIMTRHGLDSVLSLKEKFGETVPRWVDYWTRTAGVHFTFAERNPRRCLVVRYEDLVRRPQPTIDAIFRFLGEKSISAEAVFKKDHGAGSGDHKILGTSRIHAESVGRWRSWAPAEYEAALRDCPGFHHTMARLGYEPVDSPGSAAGKSGRSASSRALRGRRPRRRHGAP